MDSYIGMIIHWPLNWAPSGWHNCDGTILPINGNQALYSILGSVYGGDGKTTFALPDFRSRVPVGYNPTEPTDYGLGKTGGSETVTLNINQIPSHTHTVSVPTGSINLSAQLTVSTSPGTTPGAATANSMLAQSTTTTVDINTGNPYEIDTYEANGTNTPVVMNSAVATTVNSKQANLVLATSGSSLAHSNMQPFETMNFIISLTGFYPSRD